ncbi:hypothetical protein BB561_000113 [Smittium simulii]|uniref:Uncharacterized protein n=1 Tax=Smittium simulii TaxID=133385 RepID=A0A2T9Z0P0_9FUNG|nr:hypothetical protein BB561_000113 [Smittium simulii]
MNLTFKFLKTAIKDSAIPSYNKLKIAKKLCTDANANVETTVLNHRLNKRGTINQFDIIPNNFIVSDCHFIEFMSLPNSILDVEQAQKKTLFNPVIDYFNITFQKKICKTIGEMFSTVYLNDFIRADGIDILQAFDESVQEFGCNINSDTIKIQDTTEFISDFLYKNARLRIFGKRLSKHEDLLSQVKNLDFTVLLKTMSLFNYIKTAIKMYKIIELIGEELNHNKEENVKIKPQRGTINQFDIIPNNFIVSDCHFIEFMSLPTSILDVEQAQKKTLFNPVIDYFNITFQKKICKTIGEMFSTVYLNDFIRADGIDILQAFDESVQEFGCNINSDTIKIQDTTEFISDFLYKNARLRIFGKRLSKHEDLLSQVKNLDFTVLLKTMSLFNYIKTAIKMYKIIELIGEELNHNKEENVKIKPQCAIDIIKDQTQHFSQCDTTILAYSLQRLFWGMIAIPPTRIFNILVDIASQPYIYNLLLNEQEHTIYKHGKDITMHTLLEMKFLDAFIIESLNLSSPASCIHRKLNKPVVFSNGTSISSKSMISLNLFSRKHNNNNLKSKKAQNTLQFLQKKPKKDQMLDNLVWGFGEYVFLASLTKIVKVKMVDVSNKINQVSLNQTSLLKIVFPEFRP